MAGTFAAHATETLQLVTAIPPPAGGKITSFDISFVDTATHTYILGDRTTNGVDVIDTSTNTLRFIAGHGSFQGVKSSNDVSGPDGVMIVRGRTLSGADEIWAGDGDSTLKFFRLSDGGPADVPLSTKGTARVDEMCFDPVHNRGFVANNADSPPFITAVDASTHLIIGGKIAFDGTNGTPLATNGIEQCQFNPRDNMIYVTVPEINGPGDNSAPGGVARIDPVSRQVVATFVIPHADCAGPQGLAIGPLVGDYGEMLTGCNGAVANAGFQRTTALIDDGSVSGVFGRSMGADVLPFQAGNDEITFNAANQHYYLARSGNNSFANPQPDPVTGVQYGCPNNLGPNGTGATNYGGAIYVAGNTPGESFSQSLAGPQVLGNINALTLQNDPDTITGLINCPASAPGPGGVGKAGVANLHGSNHSVAADSEHNQIYVPIASTAVAPGMTGLCARGGAVDANGCIAVFTPVGSDP